MRTRREPRVLIWSTAPSGSGRGALQLLIASLSADSRVPLCVPLTEIFHEGDAGTIKALVSSFLRPPLE